MGTHHGANLKTHHKDIFTRDIPVRTSDHKSILLHRLSHTTNEARAETCLLLNNFKLCRMSRKLNKYAFIKTFVLFLFIVVLHNNTKLVFQKIRIQFNLLYPCTLSLTF